MTVDDYIKQQHTDRQETLYELHACIIANDSNVEPIVEPMMGKEMIIYKERGYMKYGLASIKNYMSLHCMPMYMNKALHEKYEKLLRAAKFQKGCINFTSAKELPKEVVKDLIAASSAISIADILEKRNKKSR